MRRCFACTTAILIGSMLTLEALSTQKDGERHVFVTALDKDGTPIVGLTTEHFAVRESGRDRTVLRVEPLRTPMHVAVLVDTSVANGAPDDAFRSAVVGFTCVAAQRTMGLNTLALAQPTISSRP